ncbi:MAG: hypothetical protein H7Z75_01670 [Ferruginibacter sp.]|nr:hypothetical protein [Cytophagales bacterium]
MKKQTNGRQEELKDEYLRLDSKPDKDAFWKRFDEEMSRKTEFEKDQYVQAVREGLEEIKQKLKAIDQRISAERSLKIENVPKN